MNFFSNSFDDKSFGTAMFARIAYDAPSSARHTPNNTTTGYHRKVWLIQNGQLVLAKGGSAQVQVNDDFSSIDPSLQQSSIVTLL